MPDTDNTPVDPLVSIGEKLNALAESEGISDPVVNITRGGVSAAMQVVLHATDVAPVDHVAARADAFPVAAPVTPPHVAASILENVVGEIVPTATAQGVVEELSGKLAETVLELSGGDPKAVTDLVQTAGESFQKRAEELVDSADHPETAGE